MTNIPVKRNGQVITHISLGPNNTIDELFSNIKNLERFGQPEGKYHYIFTKVKYGNLGHYIQITSEHPSINNKLGLKIFEKNGNQIQTSDEYLGYSLFEVEQPLSFYGFDPISEIEW